MHAAAKNQDGRALLTIAEEGDRYRGDRASGGRVLLRVSRFWYFCGAAVDSCVFVKWIGGLCWFLLLPSHFTMSGVPRTTGVSSPHRTQVMRGAPYRIEWSQGIAVTSVSIPSESAPKVT